MIYLVIGFAVSFAVLAVYCLCAIAAQADKDGERAFREFLNSR